MFPVVVGLSKPSGDSLLNGRCRPRGIRSVTDGSSHDDVVRPGLESGFHIDGPFLVIGTGLHRRANTGDDDAKRRGHCGANSSGLVAGTDDAGAADTLRPTGSREDDVPNVRFEAEVFHIRPVETGEDGHGQNSEIARSGVAGGAEDGIVTMHRDEIHVPGSELSDRGADGLRDIEELEVGEYPFVFGAKPIGQFEVSPGKEELQADLIKGNGIGQRVDGLPRLRGGWNVQREDQPVGCGDRRLPKLLSLRARRSEFRSVFV